MTMKRHNAYNTSTAYHKANGAPARLRREAPVPGKGVDGRIAVVPSRKVATKVRMHRWTMELECAEYVWLMEVPDSTRA